jgi:pimeloyl-[acyl-carrier protein] methyl ester esterase
MSPNPSLQTHLIALHGWAGDSRSWHPWAALAEARGWRFSAAERGYGSLQPQQQPWDPQATRRVVIGHSMGPHLLPAALWEQATDAVLLASFAAFTPPGREGRATQAALRAMAARLERGEATALLREFFREAAAPQPPGALPPGPLEQGIGAEGLQRLIEDLQQLGHTAGLPQGYPSGARALIVEAADDRIVHPRSRAALREALPAAEVWTLPGAGHCLLDPELPARVLGWIDHAAS